MEAFLSDPLFFVGVAFGLAATIAFIIFASGFFPGLPHLFTLSGNADSLPGHRMRAMWGLMLLIFIFVAWELVRWIAGWV